MGAHRVAEKARTALAQNTNCAVMERKRLMKRALSYAVSSDCSSGNSKEILLTCERQRSSYSQIVSAKLVAARERE